MAVLVNEPPASKRRAIFPIFSMLAAGAIGIFFVPWFIPFSRPVNSLSYTYGFNNFAAWVAVAALLAVTCLIRAAKHDTLGTSALEHRLSEIVPDDVARPNPRLLAAFVAIAIIGAALEILCYSLLPSNDFGEITQHMIRLDLMTLGERPHTDFQYNFGPGMLYAVYGLYRLGAGAMSIDTAYCATLSAYWVIGAFLLYYVVKNLADTVKKTTVFVCISLLFLNPTMMGLQYTPLRYLLPLASLLFVHKSVLRRRLGLAIAMAAALLLPLTALAFSPDAGIATTAALLVYFTALLRTRLRKFSLCAVASTLAVAIGLATFGRDYLASVRSYSNAVSAFPIFPTFAVVAFLAGVFVILPGFVSMGLRQRTPAGSLALGMTVALGLGIPPALGRCDLVHTSFNGAGVLLMSLAVLTTLRDKRVYRAALCAYVVVFPLSTLTAMMWHSYGGAALRLLREATSNSDRGASGGSFVTTTSPGPGDGFPFEGSARSPYRKPQNFSPDLRALLHYQKVGIPFGASEDVRRFLKITGRFAPDYWPGSFSYLGTEADIARKLRDLETMDVILAPRGVYLVDNFLSIEVTPDLRSPTGVDPVIHRRTAAHVLTTVTLFPVWLPKARHAPLLAEVRIMAEIARRYRPRGQFRGYIIAAKRDFPPQE